ncbi:sphingosine-1-phosphate phosphatase 1 [Engraulis encrasicolus]|uniref:sphingosine-1-phosphate phosphatase 1 n=1 Tax=Engraulis encrasicolus TaxID=184585 RepID=UPI002FCFB86C
MASRFKELWYYLQDPHHVARFQRLCGVRGTLKSTDGGETKRQTEALGNGTYGNGLLDAGGKGQTPGHMRQRRTASTENCRPPTGASDTDISGRLVLGAPEVSSTKSSGDGECGLGEAAKGASDSNGTSTDGKLETAETVKPLRKNSLTGDAGQEFLIENKFLFYLFTLGTELGNELFYIIFFPFVLWNVDALVSRRLVVVWVWVMYIGQCTKDLFRWPRPASPPVVKVEMFYNSEYSMPSTHAMSGTAIPFALFLITYGRWEYPFLLGLLLALCWCVLVCVSRIYMGMHSILDIIVGHLYSVLILFVGGSALGPIDDFYVRGTWPIGNADGGGDNRIWDILGWPVALESLCVPALVIVLHVGTGLLSFTLDAWSTSRGDTAQILGSGAGLAVASHLNQRLGLLPDPPLSALPLRCPALSALPGLACASVLRSLLGVCVLLATRAAMKALVIPLACRVAGVPSSDVRKARQHMSVELPYRYIVYGTVGFNTLFLVPLLFSLLQLA